MSVRVRDAVGGGGVARRVPGADMDLPEQNCGRGLIIEYIRGADCHILRVTRLWHVPIYLFHFPRRTGPATELLTMASTVGIEVAQALETMRRYVRSGDFIEVRKYNGKNTDARPPFAGVSGFRIHSHHTGLYAL